MYMYMCVCVLERETALYTDHNHLTVVLLYMWEAESRGHFNIMKI